MINVIILNGPPGVGKDTIANAIVEQGKSITHLRFKDQLYRETFELFSSYYRNHNEGDTPLTYGEFTKLCTDRVAKETPQAALSDLTPRQALIHTSENVVKPLMGADHYGIAAADSTELALALYKTVVSR